MSIYSSCIERQDNNELMCLMAHECGYILCKHVLNNSAVELQKELGERYGLISDSLSGPIYLGLQYWSSRSDLSAARCAAATMGEETFQRMTMKMASSLIDVGHHPYQFVKQAKSIINVKRNKNHQNCSMAFYSHPKMINRTFEIDRWKRSAAL